MRPLRSDRDKPDDHIKTVKNRKTWPDRDRPDKYRVRTRQTRLTRKTQLGETDQIRHSRPDNYKVRSE